MPTRRHRHAGFQDYSVPSTCSGDNIDGGRKRRHDHEPRSWNNLALIFGTQQFPQRKAHRLKAYGLEAHRLKALQPPLP